MKLKNTPEVVEFRAFSNSFIKENAKSFDLTKSFSQIEWFQYVKNALWFYVVFLLIEYLGRSGDVLFLQKGHGETNWTERFLHAEKEVKIAEVAILSYLQKLVAISQLISAVSLSKILLFSLSLSRVLLF